MLIMLGSGLGSDPQLPWAGEILYDSSTKEPTLRIDRLYDAAIEYLDQVVGKDEVFPVEALRTFLNIPIEQLHHHLIGGTEQGVLDTFRVIWPQKYALVGDSQLKKLIAEGVGSATRYGLTGSREAGFFLILMFVLGHSFDCDPQYSFLTMVLTDKNFKDEPQKPDRLNAVLRANLSKALGL